ncbi:(d)CMP kinase [Halanaerobaculum tunisiense]
MDKELTVAIDGPAGAGKSTVAKEVATRLGYIYVDTGAMYRAITYKALQADIDLESETSLVSLAQQVKIRFQKQEGQDRVLLDGIDVTEEIRSSQVSNHVSLVSQVGGVREELVTTQRKIASQSGVVMDGRDIGTVVVPKAEVKVFLTASVEERTKRRYEQLNSNRQDVSFSQLKQEIIRRDKLDRNREVSPLKQAQDAIKIDTTNLTIDQVVNKIISLCQEA